MDACEEFWRCSPSALPRRRWRRPVRSRRRGDRGECSRTRCTRPDTRWIIAGEEEVLVDRYLENFQCVGGCRRVISVDIAHSVRAMDQADCDPENEQGIGRCRLCSGRSPSVGLRGVVRQSGPQASPFANDRSPSSHCSPSSTTELPQRHSGVASPWHSPVTLTSFVVQMSSSSQLVPSRALRVEQMPVAVLEGPATWH